MISWHPMNTPNEQSVSKHFYYEKQLVTSIFLILSMTAKSVLDKGKRKPKIVFLEMFFFSVMKVKQLILSEY
jgi:hypothetical protein